MLDHAFVSADSGREQAHRVMRQHDITYVMHLAAESHVDRSISAPADFITTNFGPYQFPEKLIPVVIQSLLSSKAIPVYGDGLNVRDWLYVSDHVEALWTVLNHGKLGESYNVGGLNEMTNLQLAQHVCDLIDELKPESGGNSRALITYVIDRPGHDRRYAIDASKIERELGWRPVHSFEGGIRQTVSWYLDHQDWVNAVNAKETV